MRRRAGTREEAEAVAVLEAVLAAHGDALRAFAHRLVGRAPEAEDLVQETLLRAWRHPSALDGSKGSARAWLFTVARNLAVDLWRGQARMAGTQQVGSVPTRTGGSSESSLAALNWDFAEVVVEEALVSVALESLSEEHRQVLVRAVWLDHPVARIADDLGIPPGTVKSRIHYGLKAARLALDEMGYRS